MIKIGGPVDKIKVGLRVIGDSLDPNEVTKLLGCEPTKAKGNWILDGKLPPTDDFEVQIENLLASVTDDLSAWKALADKYRIDIYCGLFLKDINRGCDLSSKIIKALSERNISICFDIYVL